MSNSERLIAALAPVFASGEAAVDPKTIDRLAAGLAGHATDDFAVEMHGPDEVFVSRREGIEGLRQSWADWLDTFSEVRLEIEGVEEHGENVITYARQVGVTRVGGVEIEQPSASVWKFRDGLVHTVEFHLDRERAERSARES